MMRAAYCSTHSVDAAHTRWIMTGVFRDGADKVGDCESGGARDGEGLRCWGDNGGMKGWRELGW